MSTITKQWLQQKIAEMEAARDEIPFGLGEDDSNTLAALRIALASLEAEPVAYIFKHPAGRLFWSLFDESNKGQSDVMPVYTAPPAPVVPCPYPCGWDNLNKYAIHDAAFVARGLVEGEEVTGAHRHAVIANNDRLLRVIASCRAAMLQGAENVKSRCATQTAPALDSSPKIAESTSGNSPVIPDWQTQAEKMAELYGSSFVLFRNGESPQCADPSKVIISFTDEGLGHGAAAPQQEAKNV
ncbi:hypothetical protein N4235_23270 [Enterobacter asburiae]|uniref:hypothetical protein n=1 Tax=Enterobacter asburiae TaxID=61645 RepID=UPI0029667344|nr:hypothetical protein [Enterobacter asburiae]MDW3573792.1 hypothetical protein [Enterobacter asburiae]